jgi:formate dehydrogenase major subunit
MAIETETEIATTPSIEIELDGRAVAVAPQTSVLQAILATGQAFPHICYHPALGPLETCDTCIAEVDGQLRRACATPVAQGMKIRTGAGPASAARSEAMNRVLRNHDLYCTVCDNNNGNCVIHNTAMQMRVEHQRYPFTPKGYAVDASNPFYRYDPDQCILCGRCVEACQNLQVSEVLSIAWDRERPRVIWDADVPINESSCVSCGHCVTVCPCNALMENSMLGEAGFLTGVGEHTLQQMIDVTKRVEPSFTPIFAISEVEAKMREARIKKTKTVCTYCGVGCSFDIWTKGRKILRIAPSMRAPANQVSTCVKGKFGWDYVNSPDRLTQPMIRKGDGFQPATWDEALDYTAQRLLAIRREHGDDAIGFISSSKCTNEENYMMQKLARSVMHTHNIDNCSRYCQAPATEGLRRTMGYGGDSGSISDLAQADLVMIVGANPAESHPVLSTRIRRAHKLHGQKLIVSDLRKNPMAARADVFLHPKPASDLVWISAITKYILDQGKEDKAFLASRVQGLDDYRTSLAKFTLEFAEGATSIPQATLIRVADMIVSAKSVCIAWAMGVTQHVGGSDTCTAICNLLLVTGNVGRPGTGAYPLRGHNNVQGAGDFGCSPAFMPGYERADDPAVRAKYAKAWGAELPTNKGLDNHLMINGIHEGKLRALVIEGEEIALVDSNSHYVQQALEKLDFAVVIESFFSKTCQYADVILPASISLEKEGTFTSTERRTQRLYQALPSLGDSRPDWQIIQDLANRLGGHWNYQHPGEVLNEAASVADILTGLAWERLEGYASQQWPVLPDGTSTPLHYVTSFPRPGGQAQLYPVDWTPTFDAGPEYDLHLNNGRMLEHFHEGTLTYRVAGIRDKVPETYVEVSPDLARERGIETGAVVRLISPNGALKLPVVVTDRVLGHELYLPMNAASDDEAVNYLTGDHSDKATHTPAYKEVSVRMEVIAPKGKSPMSRSNPRMGHPNPQPGVNVAQKWARSDYEPLVRK